MKKSNIERNSSSGLATKIAQCIDSLLGTHEWSGDQPYEIRMFDSKESRGFVYQLRKGGGWITIQERISDNPRLVSTFYLKKGVRWEYEDLYLKKYGKSSLYMLQTIYKRFRMMIKISTIKSQP